MNRSLGPWGPSRLLSGLALGTALAIASLQSVAAAATEHLVQIPQHRLESNGVIPVSIENGQLIVQVTINSQGPFPMIFDTGGVESVTPETATKLGLATEGNILIQGSGEGKFSVPLTRLKDVSLGPALLSDLTVPVIPLPRFFTDRGTRPPIAGVVSYDFLKRYAVRVAYEEGTMTLTPTSDFHYHGDGEHISLSFADRIPVMPGAVDGFAGKFEIDTGSSGALVLQRAFVDKHGLEARHPINLRVKSGGVDGLFETVVARIDRFNVGSAEIKRPVAEFPSGGRVGLPLAGIDGSVGYQILRQFIITLDYPRKDLWLERSTAFGMKTAQWKTGFQALKTDGPEFRVVTVLPNTPAAAAGVIAGDVITEINGLPASSVGQAEFGALTKGSDGTVIHLKVVRDGVVRSVALTLKELVP